MYMYLVAHLLDGDWFCEVLETSKQLPHLLSRHCVSGQGEEEGGERRGEEGEVGDGRVHQNTHTH